MQERSHAFAMKSQMWLLDPRPNLPCIVQAVKDGFDLSEASSTPVMLQLRIRACHVHGQFVTSANRRPAFTIQQAMEHPVRDVSRIVLPPASFVHEQEKVKDRWPAAVRFIEERKLNEFFSEDADDIGIAVQGGSYNTVLRALERLGLADVYGESKLPLYVMNVAYPLIDAELHALLRRQARGAAWSKRASRTSSSRTSPTSCARPGRQLRCTARTCCRWPGSTARRPC